MYGARARERERERERERQAQVDCELNPRHLTAWVELCEQSGHFTTERPRGRGRARR